MSLVVGEVGSLWNALASVPDHRIIGVPRGSAIRRRVRCGVAIGPPRPVGYIVRWGWRLTADALASIGISRARVSAPSVWCELFKGLDVGALERALGDWVRGEQPAGHVAIDGERLRGSATAQSPGVHLLAAFSASLQGVISQLAVVPDANEITAAVTTAEDAAAQGRLCRCVRRPQHLAHWVRLLRRGINLEITWFRQSFS